MSLTLDVPLSHLGVVESSKGLQGPVDLACGIASDILKTDKAGESRQVNR